MLTRRNDVEMSPANCYMIRCNTDSIMNNSILSMVRILLIITVRVAVTIDYYCLETSP